VFKWQPVSGPKRIRLAQPASPSSQLIRFARAKKRRIYYAVGVAVKTCTVSCTGPSGVRYSVDVSGESLYEVAIIGVSLLKQDGWTEPIAPGVVLEIEVKHPATRHSVSLSQLRRWVEGIAVSPDDTLRKRKLKAILG
jgi:hypothetical protein